MALGPGRASRPHSPAGREWPWAQGEPPARTVPRVGNGPGPRESLPPAQSRGSGMALGPGRASRPHSPAGREWPWAQGEPPAGTARGSGMPPGPGRSCLATTPLLGPAASRVTVVLLVKQRRCAPSPLRSLGVTLYYLNCLRRGCKKARRTCASEN
ncbi:myosin IC heavy chain-like [Corvus cornix cornix]|uniref:myosin IC heavy chain-like n=1 Tax=Corvus cornix cornix TaxID=932674 RepID=UPI001950FC21|nr:myosin IC heavy chain-like [Corvus cornix cornix]